MTKKIFYISLCFFMAISTLAQKKNRDFERLIKKYDVTSILQTKSGSPEEFWHQLVQNHQGLAEYTNALARKKKTALDAENDVMMALGLVESEYSHLYVYNDSIIDDYTSRVSEDVMGTEVHKIRLHIAYGKTPNAFCTPRGDIFIYAPLLDRIDYDYKMLYGICAHEVAHYYLRHTARQKWADEKHARKNRIMAGIAIGLNAVADVANAYTAGYTGQTYESHLEETCNNILASAAYDNQMFHFKYSREEEIEADIVAHRFLEFIGITPSYYTQALSALGTQSDYFYSDWSDHPTIDYRVNFLNYLSERYPLHNKGNTEHDILN